MSKSDRGMTTRQQHAQPPSDRQAWSDDDLMLAIASGDELALRVLYDRHVRWIAVRFRRSLPVSAVEDTLQKQVERQTGRSLQGPAGFLLR